ncbi:unnamed protein product [Amoebophrya sp. A25]|nr:unnamed protein product [Amoebophrya sp. A25]|eukprot:GSA25T00022442001.1
MLGNKSRTNYAFLGTVFVNVRESWAHNLCRILGRSNLMHRDQIAGDLVSCGAEGDLDTLLSTSRTSTSSSTSSDAMNMMLMLSTSFLGVQVFREEETPASAASVAGALYGRGLGNSRATRFRLLYSTQAIVPGLHPVEQPANTSGSGSATNLVNLATSTSSTNEDDDGALSPLPVLVFCFTNFGPALASCVDGSATSTAGARNKNKSCKENLVQSSTTAAASSSSPTSCTTVEAKSVANNRGGANKQKRRKEAARRASTTNAVLVAGTEQMIKNHGEADEVVLKVAASSSGVSLNADEHAEGDEARFERISASAEDPALVSTTTSTLHQGAKVEVVDLQLQGDEQKCGEKQDTSSRRVLVVEAVVDKEPPNVDEREEQDDIMMISKKSMTPSEEVVTPDVQRTSRSTDDEVATDHEDADSSPTTQAETTAEKAGSGGLADSTKQDAKEQIVVGPDRTLMEVSGKRTSKTPGGIDTIASSSSLVIDTEGAGEDEEGNLQSSPAEDFWAFPLPAQEYAFLVRNKSSRLKKLLQKWSLSKVDEASSSTAKINNNATQAGKSPRRDILSLASASTAIKYHVYDVMLCSACGAADEGDHEKSSGGTLSIDFSRHQGSPCSTSTNRQPRSPTSSSGVENGATTLRLRGQVEDLHRFAEALKEVLNLEKIVLREDAFAFVYRTRARKDGPLQKILAIPGIHDCQLDPEALSLNLRGGGAACASVRERIRPYLRLRPGAGQSPAGNVNIGAQSAPEGDSEAADKSQLLIPLDDPDAVEREHTAWLEEKRARQEKEAAEAKRKAMSRKAPCNVVASDRGSSSESSSSTVLLKSNKGDRNLNATSGANTALTHSASSATLNPASEPFYPAAMRAAQGAGAGVWYNDYQHGTTSATSAWMNHWTMPTASSSSSGAALGGQHQQGFAGTTGLSTSTTYYNNPCGTSSSSLIQVEGGASFSAVGSERRWTPSGMLTAHDGGGGGADLCIYQNQELHQRGRGATAPSRGGQHDQQNINRSQLLHLRALTCNSPSDAYLLAAIRSLSCLTPLLRRTALLRSQFLEGDASSTSTQNIFTTSSSTGDNRNNMVNTSSSLARTGSTSASSSSAPSTHLGSDAVDDPVVLILDYFLHPGVESLNVSKIDILQELAKEVIKGTTTTNATTTSTSTSTTTSTLSSSWSVCEQREVIVVGDDESVDVEDERSTTAVRLLDGGESGVVLLPKSKSAPPRTTTTSSAIEDGSKKTTPCCPLKRVVEFFAVLMRNSALLQSGTVLLDGKEADEFLRTGDVPATHDEMNKEQIGVLAISSTSDNMIDHDTDNKKEADQLIYVDKAASRLVGAIVYYSERTQEDDESAPLASFALLGGKWHRFQQTSEKDVVTEDMQVVVEGEVTEAIRMSKLTNRTSSGSPAGAESSSFGGSAATPCAILFYVPKSFNAGTSPAGKRNIGGA